MSRRSLFLNLIFLSAIFFSIVATKHLVGTTAHYHKDNPFSSDSYIINATYLRTNIQGQEDIVLTSPMIKHYPNQNSSTFIKPSIKFSQNNQAWFVTALNGQGINGTDKFILSNQVLIKQPPSDKNPGTQLATQSLTIFPKKDLVTTNDIVFIEQPGIKVSGTGLRGDLKSGNIQLLSKARGQYDPKRAH